MQNMSPEQLAQVPGHARRAEPDDRAARARRGVRLRRVHGAVRRPLPRSNPKTLDELLEQMARRMAAMCRLLASMSPEQRAELQALAEQMMQDMDLAFEVDRLGANLAERVPGDAVGRAGDGAGEGEEPMPLSATVDAMERLHDYEDLDRSDARRVRRRLGGRRRRGGAAPDPRRAGGPRPPAAEADRARAGAGRAGHAPQAAAWR